MLIIVLIIDFDFVKPTFKIIAKKKRKYLTD